MVQDEDRNKTLDVNVLRGAGGEIMDHHLIIAKMIYLRRWTGRVVNMTERYEIKVSEPKKITYKLSMMKS